MASPGARRPATLRLTRFVCRMNSRHQGPGPTPSAAVITTPPVNPLQHGLALFHATPPDYRRAVGWFRAAAEGHDGDGLAMLGLCHLDGLGLPADAVQARVLLQQAAARGSAIGRFQLGRVLLTGRGGPADEEGGLSAYVAAAAQGHAEATFNLANCLYAGMGCLPDRLAAKALYLRSRPSLPVKDRVVIVVDDGIATGGTAKAALMALSRNGAARVVLAVPVAPSDVVDEFSKLADEVICLARPEPFLAVGFHYADFSQTSDEAVVALLDRAASRSVEQGGHAAANPPGR